MKQSDYNPSKIEKKWQKEWAKKQLYKVKDKVTGKKNFYTLFEFPYPSGNLHIGHWYAFAMPDIFARMKRMQGYNVLFPIGFDSFGLPAENAAIKRGLDPKKWTYQNIAYMEKQLQSMGASFDWSRKVVTSDSEYYKWTQWLFLQFFKKGLAYKKKASVNWCPTDQTVLANEQVVDGKCERCGTEVVQKDLEQWFFKITDYADRLLEDLDATDYEMPKLVDKVNPHQKGKPLVKRHVAHAIVYDPKNKKYLIIRNKKFGWDTVIIGGIEGNDSVEETARREVREETGYTDLEFKRILGGPTEAHYYTAHKGQNRIAIAEAAYFELRSDAREQIQTETLTQGEADHNEVLWVDPEDFVPGKMVNSELPIWLERLGVEVYYDKRHPTIPCFKDVGHISGYRNGLKDVERKGIVAVVKHWKEDKFIALDWKKVQWHTLLSGGIDEGQTAEEAVIREIEEETGYQNFKSIQKIGEFCATFYHPPKGENRYGHYSVMYVELKEGKRKKLTVEEQSNHEIHWLPREKMGDFITTISHKHAWNTIFLGKKSHFIELAKPLLDWPESIKESQRNWIGRSEGAEIEFGIKDKEEKITVFTTRADTLFGVTALVVSPEYPELKTWKSEIKNLDEVEKYISEAKKKTEIERTDATKEKTGVELKGIKAINPANNEEIPVWVADYVLAGYGTGAVMSVPAHDERDFAFAKKYKLPLKEVVAKYLDGVPLKPGLEVINRRTITAIIKNPKNGKYLLLKEASDYIFPGGGVEKGESIEDAIRREIEEETGFFNISIKSRVLEHLVCEGYRAAKNRNQRTDDVFVYVEILDEVQKENESDQGKHEVKWFNREEVAGLISWRHHQYGWDIFTQPKRAFMEEGIIVNSGGFDGMKSQEARDKMTEKFGRKIVKYKLRDWLLSRQRYWGAPIPVVYDPDGKPHAVPDKYLPWKLPTDKIDLKPKGKSPLASSKELQKRTEKLFGKGWTPEYDTMDTFVDSSWYFLRYTDPNNKKKFADKKKLANWMPIDRYSGGAEHTTMHLLYSRFFHKALFDMGLVGEKEPYMNRMNRGLILGPDGQKMSKSKGNVIDPDEQVKRVGSDAVRMYLAFIGPYNEVGQYPWDIGGIVGVRRFLERTWRLQEKVSKQPSSKSAESILHQTIKKVSEDIVEMKFNTAISSLMVLLNSWEKEPHISRLDFSLFLQLIAPFAPHISEEIWGNLGNKKSIHLSSWPKFDPKKIVQDEVMIGVQINGKVRAEIKIPFETTEEEAKKMALEKPEVKKWLDGKEIKKVIFVPGKILNIVV